MATWRFYLLVSALLGVLLFLQYRLWFEAGGMRDLLHLKQKLAAQQIANEKFKQQNDDLLFQIKRLKNSEDSTESRARSELGMVKEGETYYQIIKN